MMRRLLIVSLKYSPGLRKEFTLIGAQAAEHGCEVAYFIAPEYASLGGELPGELKGPPSRHKLDIVIETLREVLRPTTAQKVARFGPDIVLFYNFHPLNQILATTLKKTHPGSEIAVFVHDPKRNRSTFRFADRLYYSLAEMLESIAIVRADHVVVASDYGRLLLEERFGIIKGKCHVARLLVPDVQQPANACREFITMLGHHNSATGHEDFFDLLEYASDIRPDLRFALVTSSSIKKFVAALSERARALLMVINRPLILDDEINQILRRSYAVLRLDRQLAQSGVVPLAFMNGASVIVRDIPGLRQDIDPGQTGFLLPFHFTGDHVLRAIDSIVKEFPRYSQAARLAFEARWSVANFTRYYQWLYDSRGD